ncbi:MAG TPA: hypothetical protein PLL78_10750 [Fimbriimonadaceae bacterium]|nr:hypothetical protein [Fimbriimonadaceae bacterium]HRJ97154.1 hypothetical protein [Fimbriimonadaceae bacterium]
MPDLFPLINLHKVDAAMVDIKRRHDHMDPGRELIAELQALRQIHAEAKAEADRLAGELKDAELEQKSVEEKIAKIDKQLYGGKVVNPREVETFQREIESLKHHREALDERILELWELVPAAQALEKEHSEHLSHKQAELDAYQNRVVEQRTLLADSYKKLAAQRPDLAKAVDPGLLRQYDAIRQKYGGIGMAEVLDSGACGSCGTTLPRRTVVAVAEDRLEHCESCHRLLFKAVPAV